MPRTRKCTHGTHLRDVVPHLPTSCSDRRASSQPDGRRQDSGVFVRPATLPKLGDVTRVRSKTRRNAGPQNVQSLVTNLPAATAETMLSLSARRWGVDVTIKARKSGLHLG